MRKLIFFWFLISIIVLFLLSSFAVMWNGPVVLQTVARYYASELISFAAHSALDEYERNGIDALDRFVTKINFRGHTIMRILDERGQELKHRPLPPALQLAAKQWGEPNEVAFQRTWLAATASYRVRGPSGKEYLMLFLFPISDVLRDLAPFSTWVIRAVVFLAIVVAMCSWLSRYLTAPLGALLDASRGFAGGNLKSRVGSGFSQSVPEIRELALGFDEMAARMEFLLERQQRLLQHLSHELRTPLTRLGLSVNMARGVAGEAAIPALNRIEQEAERLNSLIERILRLSRLESGRDLAALEPIDINDFLEGIVADTQFEAAPQGRTVRLLLCQGGKMVGDRDLLRGAFENVLRNAIRYTPAGSDIEVSQTLLDAGEIEVRIRDHGPGVPEDRLDAIFEPFVRLSPSTSMEGFGLGLSIVKRSVELHGGSVSASNAAGGGLEVRIVLPVKASA